MADQFRQDMLLGETKAPITCPKCGFKNFYEVKIPMPTHLFDEPDYPLEAEVWARVQDTKQYARCPDCTTPVTFDRDFHPVDYREVREDDCEEVKRAFRVEEG